MDAELKGRFVRALRSGDYKQTTGALRKIGSKLLPPDQANPYGKYVADLKDETFCAMGVLCDILDPKAWRGEMGITEFAPANPNLKSADGYGDGGGLNINALNFLGLGPQQKAEERPAEMFTVNKNGRVSNIPHGPGGTLQGAIIYMNDNLKLSFSEIANWVEKWL